MRSLYLLAILLFINLPAFAVAIVGDVSDIKDKAAMAGVFIQNVHTGQSITTDATGKFTISGNGDDLIEFKKMGYETKRFRIPKGDVPSYFKIIMNEDAIVLPEYDMNGHYKDFVKDSLKFEELYKVARR